MHTGDVVKWQSNKIYSVGRTKYYRMIPVIIPQGYRWESMRIQRNSLVSNFIIQFS